MQIVLADGGDAAGERGQTRSAVQVDLAPGEACLARAETLVALTGDAAIVRLVPAVHNLLAGSGAVSRFTATRAGARVWLAPALPGHVHVITLAKGHAPLYFAGGAYLASSTTLTLTPVWQGWSGLLAGARPIWLAASGAGPLALSGFGAVYHLDVDGAVLVGSGHVVAFSSTLTLSLGLRGACRLSGKGRALCQSHDARAFARAFVVRPGTRKGEGA